MVEYAAAVIQGAGRPPILRDAMLRIAPQDEATRILHPEEPRNARLHEGSGLATDARFQNLLPDADWRALPVAVRARFSAKPKIGAGAIFRGRTTSLRMNLAGRLFALLARLVGAPLPIDDHSDQCDAIVAVTDAPRGQGQVWTRLYARRDGFPQAIHSMKKFAGPTGLEEHVVDGRFFGAGMSLTLSVAGAALYFASDRYFVRILRWRFFLPNALAPGAMVIGHNDLGQGRFVFTLTLRHPAFGLMIEQESVFEDMEACHG